MKTIYLFFVVVSIGFGAMGQTSYPVHYVIPEKGELAKIRRLHLLGVGYEGLDKRILECKELRELNLSSNQLGSITSEISILSNLENLTLAYNRLSELPGTIVKLENLAFIDIEGNYFIEFPSMLFQLKNLKTIKFGRQRVVGQIESQFPVTIKNLRLLEYLDVEFANIRSLPDEFYTLTSLITINLTANKISTLSENIGSLVNLEELLVGGNAEIKRLPESIGELKKLRVIDLSGTGVTDLPESLFLLPRLHYINLAGTPLSKIIDTADSRAVFTERFNFNNKHVFVNW